MACQACSPGLECGAVWVRLRPADRATARLHLESLPVLGSIPEACVAFCLGLFHGAWPVALWNL